METPAGQFLAEEITTQPENWRQVAGRRAEVDAVIRPGQRVAVVGCGTSWFMAQAYAALRERSGAGPTDAFAGSEHHLDRGYDTVLLISRSGTTTEILEVVDRLNEQNTDHLALVATAGTPIAERARHTVLLSEVDEQSVVQTRFATSVLALLRAHLGEDLSRAADQAAEVLAVEDDPAIEAATVADQLSFLGRGWTIGLANEAALKLREATQAWTEAYPAMEYRHGPISIAAPGRLTWAFGEVPEGLADQVAATGARFVHHDIDPLADLVRIHRVCLARARANGLDPDRPRHLTRSIILS